MYALLTSPISQLPTIVSQNSLTYPELMQMGYTQVMTGTKRDMEIMEETLTVDFVSDLLELNDIN